MRTRELNNVLKKLNAEIRALERRSQSGLLAGALVVQGRAQRKVPVEYGNLRASAYARRMPENPNAVEVGFSAAYALYVHENLEPKLRGQKRPSGLGVYWGPAGEPQFLTKALRESHKEIVELVRSHGHVGGKK